MQSLKLSLAGFGIVLVMAGQGPSPVPPPVSSTVPLTVPKIALVDMKQAVAGTKDAFTAQNTLEAQFAPKLRELERVQAEIAQKKARLRELPAGTQKDQLSLEVERKQEEFEKESGATQLSLQLRQKRLLREISDKLIAVIKTYVKTNGYSMVFDLGVENGLVHAENATDITASIIEAFDASPMVPGRAR